MVKIGDLEIGKFPLLLAQGAEGIAVGLSTKILPHNFNELLNASIKHLTGKKRPHYLCLTSNRRRSDVYRIMA